MISASLHLVIASKRALIVETFVSEVRVFRLAPGHLTNAEIGQDIDAYLAALIDALAHGHRNPVGDGPRSPGVVRVAVEHAQRRARMGWDVRALLTEMGILRSTLVEIASHAGAIPIDEWERLADIMHESLIEAAAELTSSSRVASAPAKSSFSSTPLAVQARGTR